MSSFLARPFQSNDSLPFCYCMRNGCYPLVCQWTLVQFCGVLCFCPPLITSSPFPCLPSFFHFFPFLFFLSFILFPFFLSFMLLFLLSFLPFILLISSPFSPPLSLSHCLCFCFVFLALIYLFYLFIKEAAMNTKAK